MSRNTRLGQKAIVVGASTAGLLSARVLADYYDEVVVLERDHADDLTMAPPKPRKGIPQSRHIHILLSGGEMALGGLLPGFADDLVAAGALTGNFAETIRWRLAGHWYPQFQSDLSQYVQSRPLIDQVLTRKVLSIPNICIVSGVKVKDYTLDTSKTHITHVEAHDGYGNTELHSADFVVDAGGRGAFFPRWLKDSPFGASPEHLVGFDLAYSTCTFQRDATQEHDWLLTALYPSIPDELRGGVVCCIEDNQYLVTLYGYHGDHPPTDEDGFKAFAKSLPSPEIYESIKDLTPKGDIIRHKFPGSLRRHYEKMSRTPHNIIAIGDAMCSLNPAFAQGISGVALEVKAMQGVLEEYAKGNVPATTLPKRIYHALAKVIDIPWEISRDECFKYAETTGNRSVLYLPQTWIKDRIMESQDPDVLNQFFRVVHLVDPPLALAKPSFLKKVFFPRAKNESVTIPEVVSKAPPKHV